MALAIPSGAEGVGFRLVSVPRRLRKFRVSFFNDQSEELGLLTVQNPFFRNYPEWTPEPLPATHTNGPVALTLSAIEIRPIQWDRQAYPIWQVASPDPGWGHAQPHPFDYWIEDATGNGQRLYALSPQERAWHLLTWVHRTAFEDFRSEEVIVLSGVPIPGAGKIVRLRKQVIIHGVQLDFVALSGPGTVVVMNVLSESPADAPVVNPESDALESAADPLPNTRSATTEPEWRLEPNPARGPPGMQGGSGTGWTHHSYEVTHSGPQMHQTWHSPRTFLLIRAAGMDDHDVLLVRMRTDDGRSRGPEFPFTRYHVFGDGPRKVRMYPMDVEFSEGESRIPSTWR